MDNIIIQGNPFDRANVFMNEFRMTLFSYRNTNNWLRRHGKKMRRGKKAKESFKYRRKMDNSYLAHLIRDLGSPYLPSDFDGDELNLDITRGE